MLDLAALLKTPHVDSLFDISRDGSRLAFAWNKTGEWQIYETDLNIPTNIKELTNGPGGKFNPRYSPDGSHLAYAFDPDGSESYHLVVYNFKEDTLTDLTPDIPYALQPNLAWSPDGQQLAYLSNQQGHFSAYVIPSNGGTSELILDTGHPAWSMEWSPTGGHVAICCEMYGQDYGIFILNLHNKEVIELPLNAHAPHWSQDGNELVFHSDERGWFDIGLYDLQTEEILWLTESEGDSQEPVVISNKVNPSLFQYQFAYIQSKGALNWIELLGAEDERKKLQVGKGIHEGVKFTSDAKRLVCIFNSPSQPPDLWMIEIESGKSIQLTHSLPEELQNADFVMPEEVHYEGMDGKQVPALLFRSKQVPAPAVVMIHGGPNWHYSADWNPQMAYLASYGYVVLCPNYRGSTGYGREWQYAARFDNGGVDTRDVAAGAQYLMRAGLATKIAVTGRSHGGYLTMTCMTQFPELWCAGSAVVPFTNWFKSHADSREDLQHWNIENMGDPEENYERWYNASPYFFLDKISVPVQMICGGNDPRCPVSDSINTRDRLLELGKQVDFLLYEDEGHSFLKIENVIDSEIKRVAFFVQELGK